MDKALEHEMDAELMYVFSVRTGFLSVNRQGLERYS